MELSEASLDDLLAEIKRRASPPDKPLTLTPTHVVWNANDVLRVLRRHYPDAAYDVVKGFKVEAAWVDVKRAMQLAGIPNADAATPVKTWVCEHCKTEQRFTDARISSTPGALLYECWACGEEMEYVE